MDNLFLQEYMGVNPRELSPLDFAFRRTCGDFAFADGTGYFVDKQGCGKLCRQQNAARKSETRRLALFAVRNGRDADRFVRAPLHVG